mmetsp:Transcript_50676/g.101918  ORF Transcript_50676/g.101918 Transcript_50676/m.101918 type:complete len:83 (-) Transcript_50676:9-257(-)
MHAIAESNAKRPLSRKIKEAVLTGALLSSVEWLRFKRLPPEPGNTGEGKAQAKGQANLEQSNCPKVTQMHVRCDFAGRSSLF